MNFDWNAQRGRATVTSAQVPRAMKRDEALILHAPDGAPVWLSPVAPPALILAVRNPAPIPNFADLPEPDDEFYRLYVERCRRSGVEPVSRERIAVLVATWNMKVIYAKRDRDNDPQRKR